MSGYSLLPQVSPHPSPNPDSGSFLPASPTPSPAPSAYSFDEREYDINVRLDEKPPSSLPSFPLRWRLRRAVWTVLLLALLAAVTSVGFLALGEPLKLQELVSDVTKVGGDFGDWVADSWDAFGGEGSDQPGSPHVEAETPEAIKAELGSYEPSWDELPAVVATLSPSPTTVDAMDPTSFATVVRTVITATASPAPSSAAVDEPAPQVEEELKVLDEECTTASKFDRSRSAFWVVRSVDDHELSITSSQPIPAPQRHCFASAIFSVRLLSSASPAIVQSLEYPKVAIAGNSTTYTIRIPSNEEMRLPAGEYRVEVKLEFGGLQGLRDAMACGDAIERCSPKDLVNSGVADGEGFIGEKVLVDGSDLITVEGTYHLSAEICTTLSPLRGHWSDEAFVPFDCQFVNPSLPIPTDISASSPDGPQGIIWLHLIGDSNSRNLFKWLRNSFGSGPSGQHYTDSSATKNGTVASVVYRSRSGELDSRKNPDQSPDVVITWQWWSQESKMEDAEENAVELRRWADTTLEEFLSNSGPGMAKSIGKDWVDFRQAMGTTKPTRVYVSLGSHSEELTALGANKYLDILLGPVGLQSLVGSPSMTPLRFFTTTLVKSSNIPLSRFPHQDLVRNNPSIEARNDVLRTRPDTSALVVDAEGLSRGLTEADDGWMKNRNDAVHFQVKFYLEWIKLVWTDLALDRQ